MLDVWVWVWEFDYGVTKISIINYFHISLLLLKIFYLFACDCHAKYINPACSVEIPVSGNVFSLGPFDAFPA